MLFDKKKTVGVILAQLGKPEQSVESKSEEKMGGHGPLKLIAQDILAAVEGKSAVDLESALEALCAHMGDSEVSEEED